MLKCSLVLRSEEVDRSRLPKASRVALALFTSAAWPVACPAGSRAPPIARLPALKIRACSRLSSLCTPISKRSRAAITGALLASAALLRVPTAMARVSP
ncbi:hypothetical protein BZL41_01010 [Pseudomonas sp. PIC25]|nr:hypothetical protein BZL41_01010 [Pseudomonas sp. PIC25]